MTDYIPDGPVRIAMPDGDTFLCPCCSEQLPNLFVIEATDIDEEVWTERVNSLASLMRKTCPDLTERQIEIYSPMIVSANLYKESLPSRIQETVEREWEQLPLPISYVYFIQGVNGGPIKIGHSANPQRRLKDLRTSQPLRILATMMGGRKKENELHRLFSSSRTHGEWFEPTRELLSFIDEVNND
jgi:hypothetical protein